MSKKELDNLVKINRIKAEPASRSEFDGMVASARKRLTDAQNESLDPDSQFDLAYARHIGWRWPLCGTPDTGPRIELRFSRR
jgi:hypothetical protein